MAIKVTVKGNILFTPVGGCYIKRQKQRKVDIRNLPTGINGEGNICTAIDNFSVVYPIIYIIIVKGNVLFTSVERRYIKCEKG